MREIISIHIGQCGVLVGNSCWELFCLEHGIDPSGQERENIGGSTNERNSSNDEMKGNSNSFFYETKSGKLVPRALLIDLEPSVIDQVRTGTYRQLFNPDCLINGKEDSADLYTKGRYTNGKEIIEEAEDAMRKMAEGCHNLEGFMIYHSYGGGTGSGFGNLMIERMYPFQKKIKTSLGVFPSPQFSSSVVEPYNAVITMSSWMEHADLSIIFDNQSLYSICENQIGIEQPSFKNINSLIARTASFLTISQRFNGPQNFSLNEIQVNTVPYPRIHFLVSSLAPYGIASENIDNSQSISDITNAIFASNNVMASCNPKTGKYMACSMLYRGDIPLFEVTKSLIALKKQRTINFVDWCPTGFKVGINFQPPVSVEGQDFSTGKQQCCMLANSTAIQNIFEKINYKFDIMYSKRAFVHWFVGEGIDEGEFSEGRENLACLEKDYEQMTIEDQYEEIEE